MLAEERSIALRSRGADSDELLKELLNYTHSPYLEKPNQMKSRTAEQDTFWAEYLSESESSDHLVLLEKIMPQLRFPVAPGTRSDALYKQATLRGGRQGRSGALGLEYPSEFRVLLHDAGCGSVPVLLPKGRHDFRTLVQAILGRNEPIDVPDSMGACVVAGYNNWGRIHKLQTEFLLENPLANWSERFAEIREDRTLYTDEFFIISDGPYSGVPHSDLGLTADNWSRTSSQIRLHHESFHLYCRRNYGMMQTNALDETYADYVGLMETLGRFDLRWFNRFMGLEGEEYREGGRLQNYCQDLSKAAFRIICGLTRDASRNLSSLKPHVKKLSPRERNEFLLGHDLVDLAEAKFQNLGP
jgi:hypothetical protein